MKSVLLMYTESDGAKADKLQDYLQGRLRKVAELRSIIDILAEKQVFINELRAIDCVLLVGSRQASSLIKNRQQETDENFITFDGKAIHDEFSQNQDLVGKLVIVFLTERTKNDWIPYEGFDEKRVFNLQGGKIQKGNPTLYQLEYTMRRVFGETVLDW